MSDVGAPSGSWPGGSTRFAGVIGDPVAHSLSPALHNAAYRALGLDWAYGAFRVAPSDVPAAVAGAKALGFVGLSVTMPDKEVALAAADEATAVAERLGAANSLVLQGARTLAASTDGEGLLADLASVGFDPAGKGVVVLGAGGAARAAILGLAEAGAGAVTVVNRTAERAAAAAALAGAVGRVGGIGAVGDAALVVKATPLGMGGVAGSSGDEDEGTAVGSRCGTGQLVVDLVYHPPVTPFLEAAKAAGATVRNGVGMLVHVAAAQVSLWTGAEAPLEAMWAAVSHLAKA